MFRAAHDRVTELCDRIDPRAGETDEKVFQVACALLTVMRDEDSAVPLVAWVEDAQSPHALAIEGGRLLHAWHDGTTAAVKAWAVGQVSSVEVLEMGHVFPARGTAELEWAVMRWRVTLRDGTRIEPDVRGTDAADVLNVLVGHLAP